MGLVGLRCGSPTDERGGGGHLGASGGGGCQLVDEESGRWWQRADPSIEVVDGRPPVGASLVAQCVPKP